MTNVICSKARKCTLKECYHKTHHSSYDCIYPFHNCLLLNNKTIYSSGELKSTPSTTCRCIEVIKINK